MGKSKKIDTLKPHKLKENIINANKIDSYKSKVKDSVIKDSIIKDSIIKDSIDKSKLVKIDSLNSQKDNYIRLSVDVVHPIIYYFEGGDYKLEFLVDLSISDDLALSLELGQEIINYSNPNIDIYSEGVYFKLGLDNNLYENSLGENNMINVGIRYGISFYDYNVKKINIKNDYWNTKINSPNKDKNSYQTHFIEALVGIKVEIFTNIYLGWSIRVAKPFKKKNDLATVYIPGIGEGKEGWHFNYNYFASLMIRI